MLFNGRIKIPNILLIQVYTRRICIFPQTPQQVKATLIFVDEAVWRCKPSSRSGIPSSPSSVESCCRTGMGSLGQSWPQDTSLPAAGQPWRGGGRHGLPACLPESSPPVLGGLCAARLLQELLQDEASCYSLSRFNSCQHQKEVLLQAVSFCPSLGAVCGVF